MHEYLHSAAKLSLLEFWNIVIYAPGTASTSTTSEMDLEQSNMGAESYNEDDGTGVSSLSCKMYQIT